MKLHTHIFLGILLGIAILIFLIIFIPVQFKEPSHDRDWQDDLTTLSFVRINGSQVIIHNVRDATYDENGIKELRYSHKKYNLDNLTGLWLILEPFSAFEPAAHAMLTFEFSTGEFLTISIEARKEKGESFSLWSGLKNDLELIYIWATEKDHLTRRALWLDNPLYLYPLSVSKEQTQILFISLLRETNEVYQNPQFYHSLYSTCTSRLANHVNEEFDGAIAWYQLGQWAPGYAVEMVEDLGYLNISEPVSKVKDEYYISDHIKRYHEEDFFSKDIRLRLPVD